MKTAQPDMDLLAHPRLRHVNAAPVQAGRDYVLYWMTAFRRTRHNLALEHAVARAQLLRRPLLIFEPLRCDYPWASDRLHAFVVDGMHDNAAACAAAGITYFPYVEPTPGAAKGLLAALAARACVVVTDDFPCFFLPRMLTAAARTLDVRVEAVDANGLLPVHASERLFRTAASFRAHLQRALPAALRVWPQAEPLALLRGSGGQRARAEVAATVAARWPAYVPVADTGALLATLPIDHSVPVAPVRGGAQAAGLALREFVDARLDDYLVLRNEPAAAATSRLSPWLHFGHVGVHEVLAAVAARESWTPERLGAPNGGKRDGFWRLSPPAEAFLDQCVTWRELGLNACARDAAFDRFESLPAWARTTLAAHAADRRETVYSAEALAAAATHDEVWNAAQRQLLREGTMHNYLRMLWGKKIIEWVPGPRQALDVMLELNNRFALDGRDANSYSGIFWCFGRYDRPWGPQRPVFGSVRYMSSANARRKLDLGTYLERYAATDVSVPTRTSVLAASRRRRSVARRQK